MPSNIVGLQLNVENVDRGEFSLVTREFNMGHVPQRLRTATAETLVHYNNTCTVVHGSFA